MSSGVPISSQAAPPAAQPSVSAGLLWSGRILSVLVVLFLLFDGITKVMKVSAVLAASVRLGLSENLIVAIGVTLLVCTILYVIPRTSILGAILPTGYLGGAVSIQLRVGNPLFSQALFPVYFGVLVRVGLYFRDARLRALIPLRS
jgi:DoxX-like family